ncbi:hypothetical protein OG897_32245 [Streptomyces sp. NBC_00237]|uniref:hypothetical protein n=1 Tax=Streptomyces sp. NBC_00237 TaxID=2975687 RepID=UPI00225B1334|nr:hypothetical protein [Streptomyces sp. NBC_00237]MCX5206074.1 hypothetical protein [Streptomyces sp. NBC_00237]
MTTATAPPETGTEHIDLLINRATGIFATMPTDAELDELARNLPTADTALSAVVDVQARRSWRGRLLADVWHCGTLLTHDEKASATAHWTRSFGSRLRYLAYASTHPPTPHPKAAR